MIYERGVETCLPTLSLSLSLSRSFSVIHTTASSQHSRDNIQKSPEELSLFTFSFFSYIHKDSHSGGTRSYFFFCLLPACVAVKRNRVWLRSWERLFEESHLLSSFLSVYSSRLVPHVLLCFNTLLWGRMSRTHYGACVVLWMFSLVACKVPGKINFYCYFWHFIWKWKLFALFFIYL